MGVLFIIIFFIVAFLIVGLVLLQEGKGGGLTGMSTGMDGVMGAKNPLRRMTAYLFVFFVLLTISINWYFHQRDDAAVPTGAVLPASNVRELEETSPTTGPVVIETDLRPQEEAPAAPLGEADDALRPEAPAVEEPAVVAESVTPPTEPVAEAETATETEAAAE